MGDRRAVPELMGENDVVDLLMRQHTMIRDLFDEVEESPTGAQRAEAFERLVRLLAVHETAEEEVVHPYARLTIPNGDEVVRERLAEEREAKQMLAELEGMGTGHPGFSARLQVLRAAVLAHARAEECHEFAQLRARTSVAERRALAAGVKAAEALAPTHPHPGTESMVMNLLFGPPLAIVDRTRDVIRQVLRTQGG
ncbi:hemerythrin domain-containing protein [Streptosporangium sp. NPDC002721]|uniref:hemerythrin domain-containing protein n=1 Tax=Streptosporangium sp. NPDC002721 TaxID=3366188 RepID=UPI0036AB76D7